MALLKDITLGKYVQVESPIHRLDPRTKFAATLVLMGASLSSRGFAVLCFSAVFLIGVIALSRLPSGLVLNNLRAFVWLFFFTFTLHALLTPGPALWRLPYLDLAISQAGLHQGLFFTGRLATVVITASLLTLTTSPMDLTNGIERLLAPLQRFGFPAHEMAMMVSISLRFIPVLLEEADRLRRAQLARGADFSGNILRRVRNLIPLLVPLFLSAFARADRLALAMESRCYRGGEGRTCYQPLKFGRQDFSAAFVLGAFVLGVIGLPRIAF
ncbi:MAG: energy-coupling factor transporter transmembrane protein EcfT [Candidatus Latescibacteria bacterium]|nr:energy-coupling factor transporter transmembrane protein EcfT [Candidatus Latescibacterota bacterium]